MGAFVSLFRAINVGGNAAVKMDALKEMHSTLGFGKVAAYLQTGNIVFESDSGTPAEIAAQIRGEFGKRFGFDIEVMVRSAAELTALTGKNPFLSDPAKETKWIVVLFLSSTPDNQNGETLLKAWGGPEELHLEGQELFMYYPNGIGRSKLTNTFIEKKLKVVGTGRNWNTVVKLQELTRLTPLYR